MAADPKLSEIVRRLVAALHPQRVYLFGSRARGDAQDDSDYDVLLLVRDKDDRPFALEQEAYGALFGVGVGVDVIVMTIDYFERRQIVKASLPATVGREGRLLYVA
jgi:predicted nucleotidyltransferase